jgi:CheY-like chemotaxis protein
VVAISANAMPQDLERGKAAGFVDYLTKPLDVHRLLRVVDDIVGRSVSDGKHE